MIDTSAWVDLLRGIDAPWTSAMRSVKPTSRIVVGDLVMTEVLQGIRDERRLQATRERFAQFRTLSLCGPHIAEQAALNYRLLRRRGITVRGTIDVIIATWCIINRVPIIHNDRDLAVMERELGLVGYVG